MAECSGEPRPLRAGPCARIPPRPNLGLLPQVSVERLITTLTTLARALGSHGTSATLRNDCGQEFIAPAQRAWAPTSQSDRHDDDRAG